MTLDFMHEYRNLVGTTKFTHMIMAYNCSRDDPLGPVTVLLEEIVSLSTILDLVAPRNKRVGQIHQNI